MADRGGLFDEIGAHERGIAQHSQEHLVHLQTRLVIGTRDRPLANAEHVAHTVERQLLPAVQIAHINNCGEHGMSDEANRLTAKPPKGRSNSCRRGEGS